MGKRPKKAKRKTARKAKAAPPVKVYKGITDKLEKTLAATQKRVDRIESFLGEDLWKFINGPDTPETVAAKATQATTVADALVRAAATE